MKMLRNISEAEFQEFLKLTRKAHAGFNKLKKEWETVEADAELTEEEKLVRVKAIMEEIDQYADMIGKAGNLGS
jgi:hypothetical protein